MKKLTKDEFIKKANVVHQNFYDYNDVVYINMHTKVKINDPEFGIFWQTPMGHINQKQGHPNRRYIKMANKRRKPIEVFIKQAKEKHGDLYDYSKVEYSHCDTKVCIIDPTYGEFWQSPYQHLNSNGCPKRTKIKGHLIEKDHIIPLSILYSNQRQYDKWFAQRPLYKFLNSDINFQYVNKRYNKEKSDLVTINGKVVSANTVRNNYPIIKYLIETLLKVSADSIIQEDQSFINQYFML
jgi:hypothetical protein